MRTCVAYDFRVAGFPGKMAARRIFLAVAFVVNIAQITEAFSLQNLLLMPHRSSVRLSPSFTASVKHRRSVQKTSQIQNSAVSVNADRNSESMTSKSISVIAPIHAPHLVILPGFGNADVDYKNPFGAGLDRSILHALSSRRFQVHIMPLKVSIFVPTKFWCVGTHLFVGICSGTSG